MMGSEPGETRARIDKRKIKKLVKDTLLALIAKGIQEVSKTNKIKSLSATLKDNGPNLGTSLTCYGLLVNSDTKESALILHANFNFNFDQQVVFYTTTNDRLFTSFPAPGKYISPYAGDQNVFVEVIAQLDGVYLCKEIDNLRYLEISKKKENGNG